MQIIFLVADEIRPEASSKQTILGLYPDNTIVLEQRPKLPASAEKWPEGVPDGIERLAFLVNISEIEGVHSYKGQILDPEGNPHGPEISFGESILAQYTSRTLVIEAKPFIIKGKGKYHFVLSIDEERHSLPFTIIERAVINSAK